MGESLQLLEFNLHCILCGQQIFKEPFGFTQSKTIKIWNKESINSLWELVFNAEKEQSETDIITPDEINILNLNQSKTVLNKASYCAKCRQRIRDLDFYYKTFKTIQKQISTLKHIIVEEIHANYDKSVKENKLSSCSNPYQNALKIIFEDLETKRSTAENNTIYIENLCQIENIESTIKQELIEEDKEFRDGNKKDPDFQLPGEFYSDHDKFDNEDNDYEEFSNDEEDDFYNTRSKSKNSLKIIKIRSMYSFEDESKCLKRRKRKDKGTEEPEKVRKKTIPCSESTCTRYFKDEVFMMTHVRKDHLGLPNPYHCTICKKDFHLARNLRSHIYGQHEGKFSFFCPTCKKGFNYLSNLKSHIKSHHTTKSKPLNEHSCTICSKSLPNLEELSGHSHKFHTGPTPFSCSDCTEVFEDSRQLTAHFKEIHEGLKTPIKTKHLCTTCGKSFSSRWYLQTHERLAHTTVTSSGEELKCSDCLEIFPNLGLLIKHERQGICKQDNSNLNSSGFQCEICGRRLKEQNALRYHLITHSDKKPFSCTICGKGFNQTAHLKKHEQTHSGVRTHICDICGKACTNRDNLKLHLKVHDKNKSSNSGARKRSKVIYGQLDQGPSSNILNPDLPVPSVMNFNNLNPLNSNELHQSNQMYSLNSFSCTLNNI